VYKVGCLYISFAVSFKSSHSGKNLYCAPDVQSFMDEKLAERNIKLFPGIKITDGTYESSHWRKTLQLLQRYNVVCISG
jgi:hypothetical protein